MESTRVRPGSDLKFDIKLPKGIWSRLFDRIRCDWNFRRQGKFFGTVEGVERFIRKHPDRMNRPWAGNHCVIHCIALLNFEGAKLLIENGADVNLVLRPLGHPLHTVVLRLEPYLEFARYLLEHGAMFDISIIAAIGRRESIESVLKAQPELLNFKDPYANTALTYSLLTGNQPVSEYLLDMKAEVDLFSAIMLGDLEKVRKLTEKCQNVRDLPDLWLPLEFRTTFEIALWSGHKEVYDYFVERFAGRGADEEIDYANMGIETKRRTVKADGYDLL